MNKTFKLINLANKLNNNYQLIEKFSSKVEEKDYIFEYESPIKPADTAYYKNLIKELIQIFHRTAIDITNDPWGENKAIIDEQTGIPIFLSKLKEKIIEEKEEIFNKNINIKKMLLDFFDELKKYYNNNFINYSWGIDYYNVKKSLFEGVVFQTILNSIIPSLKIDKSFYLLSDREEFDQYGNYSYLPNEKEIEKTKNYLKQIPENNEELLFSIIGDNVDETKLISLINNNKVEELKSIITKTNQIILLGKIIYLSSQKKDLFDSIIDMIIDRSFELSYEYEGLLRLIYNSLNNEYKNKLKKIFYKNIFKKEKSLKEILFSIKRITDFEIDTNILIDLINNSNKFIDGEIYTYVLSQVGITEENYIDFLKKINNDIVFKWFKDTGLEEPGMTKIYLNAIDTQEAWDFYLNIRILPYINTYVDNQKADILRGKIFNNHKYYSNITKDLRYKDSYYLYDYYSYYDWVYKISSTFLDYTKNEKIRNYFSFWFNKTIDKFLKKELREEKVDGKLFSNLITNEDLMGLDRANEEKIKNISTKATTSFLMTRETPKIGNEILQKAIEDNNYFLFFNLIDKKDNLLRLITSALESGSSPQPGSRFRAEIDDEKENYPAISILNDIGQDYLSKSNILPYEILKKSKNEVLEILNEYPTALKLIMEYQKAKGISIDQVYHSLKGVKNMPQYLELKEKIDTLSLDRINIILNIIKELKNEVIANSSSVSIYIKYINRVIDLCNINFTDSISKIDYEICKKIIFNPALDLKSPNAKYFLFVSTILNNQQKFLYDSLSSLISKNKDILSENFLQNLKKFNEIKSYFFDSKFKINQDIIAMIKDLSVNLTKLVNLDKYKEYVVLSKPKNENLYKLELDLGKYKFVVLRTKDPRHFDVGVETQCCQILGGQGESSAIDSFINPLAGVLILQKNDGTLLSQSYFHYIPNDGGYILDNIEKSNILTQREITQIYKNYATLIKQHRPEIPYLKLGLKHTKFDYKEYTKIKIDEDPRSFAWSDPYSDFEIANHIDLFEITSNLEDKDNKKDNKAIITNSELYKKIGLTHEDLLKIDQFYEKDKFVKLIDFFVKSKKS